MSFVPTGYGGSPAGGSTGAKAMTALGSSTALRALAAGVTGFSWGPSRAAKAGPTAARRMRFKTTGSPPGTADRFADFRRTFMIRLRRRDRPMQETANGDLRLYTPRRALGTNFRKTESHGKRWLGNLARYRPIANVVAATPAPFRDHAASPFPCPGVSLRCFVASSLIVPQSAIKILVSEPKTGRQPFQNFSMERLRSY